MSSPFVRTVGCSLLSAFLLMSMGCDMTPGSDPPPADVTPPEVTGPPPEDATR